MKLRIVALACVAMLTGAASAIAQQEVKIGALYPLSGPTAQIGIDAVAAIKTAVEIVNEGADLPLVLAKNKGLPGLGGAKVVLVVVDHQGKPEVGQSETERLITQEKVHVVFGAYDGPVDAKPGEMVVFMGDCVKWEGKLAGELVQIGSKYKDRSTKDPHHAKHDDIYAKLGSVRAKVKQSKGATHVRFEGCPVSVAEQVLALVFLTGCKNPFFIPGDSMKFNKHYLSWKAVTAFKRLMGTPYQKPGEGERGEARPVLAGPGEAE